MPSMAAKQEIPKAAQELPEGFRNLQTYLEKKIRNLEKKKNRLDDYQKRKDSGEELNEQQAEALGSMMVTTSNIEMLKEFIQQVNDQGKVAKKAEKRQKIEKDKQELETIKRLLSIQSLLDELGSEDTKALFSSEDSLAGLTLNAKQLKALDDLYRAITPRREEQSENEVPAWETKLQQGAENCINLLEARERSLNDETNYKQINQLIDQLQRLPFFTSAAIQKFTIDEVIEDDRTPTPELNDVNDVEEVEAIAEPEPAAIQPPIQQQQQLPRQPQPHQAVQPQIPIEEPAPVAATLTEQQQQHCTLNDLRMQCKGQFDFILESEVESSEQQSDNWQSASDAAPPKSWADDDADIEQGKSWNQAQSSSSWTNQSGQADQAGINSQAVKAASTGKENEGSSSDVFSSATQSDYLKSGGDAPDNDGGFTMQTRGGGRGAIAAGPGNRGRGFQTGGYRGGRGNNMRGRPPRGMPPSDMRGGGGGGGNAYRGGNNNYNWRGRSGEDGYGPRPGRGGGGGVGGSDRGGSSSYNRPRGGQHFVQK